MKRTIALLAGLALCLAVLTAAGSETLISLSWLEGEFTRSLETAVGVRPNLASVSLAANSSSTFVCVESSTTRSAIRPTM